MYLGSVGYLRSATKLVDSKISPERKLRKEGSRHHKQQPKPEIGEEDSRIQIMILGKKEVRNAG